MPKISYTSLQRDLLTVIQSINQDNHVYEITKKGQEPVVMLSQKEYLNFKKDGISNKSDNKEVRVIRYMDKDFEGWNKVKQQIDASHKPPLFQEREIWWCSVGVNVGYEIFGKGNIYARPVLIVRKYSPYSFLGVPLTSRQHQESRYYHPITFHDIDGTALLGQFRIMDSKRLSKVMGKIGKKRYNSIKEGIKGLV